MRPLPFEPLRYWCTLALAAPGVTLPGGTARTVVAAMTNGGESPSDPSVPIAVRVGQPVTIALAANATTGYRWLLAQPPDPAVLQVQQVEYRAHARAGSASGAPVLGQGGISCWTFLAVGRGATTAGFHYRRPFALGQPPGDSTSFHIDVEPDIDPSP